MQINIEVAWYLTYHGRFIVKLIIMKPIQAIKALVLLPIILWLPTTLLAKDTYPQDVQQLIKRTEYCAGLLAQIEEGEKGSSPSPQAISQACQNLDTEFAHIKEQYEKNAKVTKALSSYNDLIINLHWLQVNKLL